MENNKYFVKFKERFNKRTDSTNFDFSKFVWKGWNEKSTVICKHHGEFESTPYKLLANKFGCAKCSFVLKQKPKTKKSKERPKEVINLLIEKTLHKYKDFSNLEFNFDNLKGSTLGTINIKCRLHQFETNTTYHYLRTVKYICPQCSIIGRSKTKTQPYLDVLSEMLDKHNFKYIYPESNFHLYQNKETKISIICAKHGEFVKSAQKHLSGQGCFKCKINELVLDGKLPGYNNYDVLATHDPERLAKPATLYYVKLGEYFKIGVTLNFKNRFKALKSIAKPYSVILLDSYLGSYGECLKLEQDILLKYKDHRLLEVLDTSEVFSIDVLNGKIKV